MSEDPMQRRLVAILAADVAGYTRLMEIDTDGTVAAWRAARADVIDPIVPQHSGRIVKLTGDGFLAVFPAAQDAVQCAIALQEGLAANSLEFRIGINLGDIIDDGEDIHGEGVNIAARLEGLSDPGGIFISGMVFEAVRNRLDAAFEDLGEHEVKHVSAPVRVWRWAAGRDAKPTEPGDGPVGQEGALSLPDIPSIAVLPFDNMSSDPEQEYFADGMTEDIITDISKLSGLLVIGRNSSFVYKGRAVDLRQVGRELGVHYVLEGSVRKSGNRLRINAQLIDTQTGHHVWAERHDGTLDDVFDLQDEITKKKFVSALAVQLTDTEKDRLQSEYTANAQAHDWFIQGRIRYREPGPQANSDARELFDKALALEPDFAWALAIRSYVKFHAWFFKWNTAAGAFADAIGDAEKAVALDPDLSAAHSHLGWMHMWGEGNGHDRALAEHEKALALDPNSPEAHMWYSSTLIYSGSPELAIAPMDRAMRLDPHYPPIFLLNYGSMYLQLGRYEEAERYLNESIEKAPEFPVSYMFLAAVRAATGDEAGAKKAGAEILKRIPKATTTVLGQQFPYAKPEHAARMINGLRMAGLPE